MKQWKKLYFGTISLTTTIILHFTLLAKFILSLIWSCKPHYTITFTNYVFSNQRKIIIENINIVTSYITENTYQKVNIIFTCQNTQTSKLYITCNTRFTWDFQCLWRGRGRGAAARGRRGRGRSSIQIERHSLNDSQRGSSLIYNQLTQFITLLHIEKTWLSIHSLRR